MNKKNITSVEAVIFEGYIILIKDGYGLILSSTMIFGRHPIWGPACSCCCRRDSIERLESFVKNRGIEILFEGDHLVESIFGEPSFSLLEMMSFFPEYTETPLLRALRQFPPRVID